MEPDELAFAGVARQAELIRDGEVSSRELVQLYLERIERLDPQLNAFRTVMAERALVDAQQADGRRGAGDDRPLLGVPLAVKDVEDVTGEVTRYGTDAFSTAAAQDSELVRRLRSAGAVIVGKTNLPELAITGDTEGPAFGVTRNPWNLDRSVGGSSGGSAAAVAAGLCAAATGSDGMGSIRHPASNCGLVGLKPTRERIPLGEHWYGLSVTGFETRNVRDTALLLSIGAADESLRDAPQQSPGRLRVAVSTKALFPTRIHPDVKRVVGETADHLRALGHEVEHADPPYSPLSPAVSRYFAGIAQDVDERTEHPDRLQRRTKGYARIGRAIAGPVREWALREDDTARMRPFFERHDVLVAPVAARPPVRAGEWEGLGALRAFLGMLLVYPFAGEWNLTGQPAISVPVGMSDDRLPIGTMIVGRHGEEATLIALAAQLEAELRWTDRRPPLS
jgi:amidase